MNPLPSPTTWPDPRTLLPHDAPLVFIERIVEAGEGTIACRVVPGTIDAEFAEDGAIPATMGVEYMAQAIGVYASLQAEPGRRRDIGYVISVRDLSVSVTGFELGRPLIVRARWQWGQDRLGRFLVSVEREDAPDGGPLTSAVMSVYRPPPEEQP
ncbi:ApeP family dehydratase [Paraliomyxa miuraensis]|uniref:ApeP family dehydratase n=1 Tax=Paraliomyxa miuraensis TaxID=376150 RepID=UPI00225BAE17|nr:hypothetical protein [Paraliomyxa miuraensis]MCX4247038.1 hypothetical protein [Paraliomyxa miuraensis]